VDAAVDIRPTYPALGFAAEAAPVRAMAGGQGPFALTWDQALRIPVPAGDVVVVVWMAWVIRRFMGTGHALVHLEPGQVVGLGWRAPQTIFGTGKLALADLGLPLAMAPLTSASLPPDPGPRLVTPPHHVRSLADVPTLTSPAAGAWHPDPTGRYAYRWWDGFRWNDAVSDGQQTLSDPVPGL